MATTTIEARCNARPTRLAFILPHPDRDLLFTVIARATSLWGGLFNPIVILDDSTRKTNTRSYFVDIFPILDDLWDKEFKAVTSPRFKLMFLEKVEAEKSLFLAARFGLYSSDEYYEFLRKNFNAGTLVYDAAFRSKP